MSYDDMTILDEAILEEVKNAMGEKFSKVINFFLEDTVMYSDQIKKGLDNNDIEDVIKGSHTIKSSSQQLGALKISAIAKDIELKGREISEKKQGTIDEIKELIPIFDDTIEKTITAIKEYNEQ